MTVTPVHVAGDEFTLMWDDDDPGVVEYRLYYRPSGATAWLMLAEEIEATHITITTSMLAHGEYEFAVSAVDGGGEESSPHTSLDPDARPAGGWYLIWSSV